MIHEFLFLKAVFSVRKFTTDRIEFLVEAASPHPGQLGQQKAISMHIWAWNSTYILLTSNGFRQMW